MTPGDVLFTVEGRSFTLVELNQQFNVLAPNLRAAEVGHGTRVELLMATADGESI